MKQYAVMGSIAAMLLLILWVRHGGKTSTPEVSVSPAETVPLTNSTDSKKSTNPFGELPTPGAPSGPVITGDVNRLETAVRLHNQPHNNPVAFYGLVVDQDTNALADVTVQLEVSESYFDNSFQVSESATNFVKKTGPDGRFEVTGVTGHMVTVENITKPGYEPGILQKHYGQFGAQSGSYTDPVIFRLWSTNLHQQLIRGKTSFEIVPDGRAYQIDLTNGTISESAQGDLKVWVRAPAQTVRGQDYDWSCEVDMINGGLLEQPPGAISLAPTEGYVPSFKFQGRLKGGQRGTPGEKCFYVQLNGGQEYGAIRIEMIAPYNKQIPGLIRLSYTVNPSGSRLLW
jgi:hypothetical protein